MCELDLEDVREDEDEQCKAGFVSIGIQQIDSIGGLSSSLVVADDLEDFHF